MKTNRDEPFKISKKSICHGCINIDQKCNFVWKNCETDSKEGKAFVSKCTKFNKPMSKEK